MTQKDESRAQGRDPWPILKASQKAVDAQMERLEAAAGLTEGTTSQGLTMEAALLLAWSARELAATSMVVVDDVAQKLHLLELRIEILQIKLETLGEKANKQGTALISAIDRFTTATNEGGQRLEKWNRVVGIANIALTLFAIAQVVVAILGLFSPPQVIVVARP